jgi:hypothetical protein
MREYQDLYAAYKNQPMERHAWQAGNEAGRVFDAKAQALDIADVTNAITLFSPEKREDAEALRQRFTREGATLQEKASAMTDVDARAKEAVEASVPTFRAALSTIGKYVDEAEYQRWSEGWLNIANGADKPIEKLKKLGRLGRGIKEKARQEKVTGEEYDRLWGVLVSAPLPTPVFTEANRIKDITDRAQRLQEMKTNETIVAELKKRGVQL